MAPAIVVRKEQVDVLRRAALDAFEQDMVEHARKYFPNHCRIGGESAVRTMIRLGIEKGR